MRGEMKRGKNIQDLAGASGGLAPIEAGILELAQCLQTTRVVKYKVKKNQTTAYGRDERVISLGEGVTQFFRAAVWEITQPT